jgi:acetylornithine/succinyldiaminopimelate/putrescine aminotransferase
MLRVKIFFNSFVVSAIKTMQSSSLMQCRMVMAAVENFSHTITQASTQTSTRWQRVWAMVSQLVAFSLRLTSSQKHGMLGTTFGGNHLACAAALAVLEVMESENLIEMTKQRGMYLINRLKAIDGIQNVRGRGLMVGFDVPEDLKNLRKKLLYDFNIFTGEAKPNVIRLLPSLAISRKQVDEFLDALQEAIEEIKSASAVEA